MIPRQILLDLQHNILELRLDECAGRQLDWTTTPAIIDIGENGRLLGVELELPGSPGTVSVEGDTRTLYVALDDGDTDNARSAPARVRTAHSSDGELLSVVVPRRGDRYEISFPSGNQ